MVIKSRTFLYLLFASSFFWLRTEAQCLWPEGIAGAYVDSVNAVSARFEKQVRSLQDAPCKPGGIVFTGSSSIRLWKTLSTDFPELPTCNTGFGGSTLPELLKYLPELILSQKPKALVIYCGENDISLPYSTVHDILDQFQHLVDSLNLHVPNIPIWYISIKPSLLSRSYLEKQNCLNTEIQSMLAAQPNPRWHFVDIRPYMLNPLGEPRPELFLRDGLHMNESGYKIWKEVLQEAIHLKWKAH